MNTQEQIVAGTKQYLIDNYGRLPLAVSRAAGSMLWDADGKEYIDLFPGFGAGGVTGHCHPAIVEAIKKQADLCLSHGNLFTSTPQVELAKRITENAFGGKVFFCHSGAEANEAAIKLVRLAAGVGKYKIISFHGCFHGRTMGGLSLTPESFQKGFEPMLPGSVKVEFGNIEAVRAAVDNETAGIFVEPIQGEGGMNIPTAAFMQDLRALCDEKKILLVCDEVWTAPARTGKWFAHQHYGITPDVMTLAKAIGGGLPVGACVASPKYADVLVAGTHGCTMGGNPLCAAAGAAAMKLIEDENLLTRAVSLGEKTVNILKNARVENIKEFRYKGLMIGLQLGEAVNAKDVMMSCLENGLIICVAKNNVVRLAPALTVEEDILEKGIGILLDTLKK